MWISLFLKEMMADIDFIGQLVDSMENAVLQLEESVSSGKNDQANKLKTFIFDLHKQIESAMRGG